jgi:hypothetical protein
MSVGERKQISVLLTGQHDENMWQDFKNPFAIGNKTKNIVVRNNCDVLMYNDPDTLNECMLWPLFATDSGLNRPTAFQVDRTAAAGRCPGTGVPATCRQGVSLRLDSGRTRDLPN